MGGEGEGKEKKVGPVHRRKLWGSGRKGNRAGSWENDKLLSTTSEVPFLIGGEKATE